MAGVGDNKYWIGHIQVERIMKKTGYRQCKLQNRNTSQVAWIPEKFAHEKTILKILNAGTWENGWMVESVGTYSDHPIDICKAIRIHRGETGDSLPKELEK